MEYYIAKRDVRNLFGELLCEKGTEAVLKRELTTEKVGIIKLLNEKGEELKFDTMKSLENNFEKIVESPISDQEEHITLIKRKSGKDIILKNSEIIGRLDITEIGNFLKEIVDTMDKYEVEEIGFSEEGANIKIQGKKAIINKIYIQKK